MSNQIFVRRGNSLPLEITPRDETTEEPYLLAEGDEIIFTVKANTSRGSPPLIAKTLTAADYSEDGRLVLPIQPEDTVAMAPADYVYDCAIRFAQGDFITFAGPEKFTVLPALSEKETAT